VRRIISISIAAILFAASSSIAQQIPAAPPPELPNPSAGANLSRPGVADVLGYRTPYEFWLTCIIITFGLLVMLLVVWHFRSIPERRAEDVARPIIIIMVITGTLILVTAGYSNEQIAPAFRHDHWLYPGAFNPTTGQWRCINKAGKIDSASGRVALMAGLIPKSVLTIAAIAAGVDAFAQTDPASGPLLGFQSRQYPGLLERKYPRPNSEAISVTNFGNKPLQLSSWDGVSSWISFQVTAGQTIVIPCSKCQNTIVIALNDGTKMRTLNIRLGESYGLYWDNSQGAWDLALIAEIARDKRLTR